VMKSEQAMWDRAQGAMMTAEAGHNRKRMGLSCELRGQAGSGDDGPTMF
jgi:hypothetical protein